MDVLRTLGVVLGFVAIGIAGWLIHDALVERVPPPPSWEVVAGGAMRIGNDNEPFAYAGGTLVSRVDAGARMWLTEAGDRGEVTVTLRGTADQPVRVGGYSIDGPVILSSTIDTAAQVRFDQMIHGASGFGEARLPETYAVLAGKSRFDIRSGGEFLYRDLAGVFAVAHGLRRDDGSIRNQGLVFNPLLRDRTIFSDSKRLEMTVLVYAVEGRVDPPVVIHVVFRDIAILPPDPGNG